MNGRRLFGLAIAAAIVGVIIWGPGRDREPISQTNPRSGQPAPSPKISQPAPSPKISMTETEPLELLSFRCEIEHSYVFVRGEVRNVSDRPIENLMAVGTFRAKDGTLIKSGHALVEYDPLMPGQASPFEVSERQNPMITKCQVDFKTLWGPTLAYTRRG